MLAELHRSGVCREGALWLSLSVSVPEQSQLCQRHIPRAFITCAHGLAARRRCALAAGTDVERLCSEPGRFFSPRSAVPLLSKANHPRNNEPSLTCTAPGQHKTPLPDKGEKPEVGKEGLSWKTSPATRGVSAKGHQTGGIGSPRQHGETPGYSRAGPRLPPATLAGIPCGCWLRAGARCPRRGAAAGFNASLMRFLTAMGCPRLPARCPVPARRGGGPTGSRAVLG